MSALEPALLPAPPNSLEGERPREPQTGRCPVCNARFRGQRLCSRCGADLTVLMRLRAQAWALRQAAAHHFAAGDAPAALRRLVAARGALSGPG